MTNQFITRKPEYLNKFSLFNDKTSLNVILDLIKKIPKNKIKICDAMCGTGNVGLFLHKKVQDKIDELVFTDGSKKMLDSFDTKFKKVIALSDSLPFKDNLFDVLICRYGLNNIKVELYPKIMKEYLRVIKAEGVVVIQDHFPRNEKEKKGINRSEEIFAELEKRGDKPFIPSLDEFEQMVKSSGGTVIHKETIKCKFDIFDRIKTKKMEIKDIGSIIEPLEAIGFIEEKTETSVIVSFPLTTIMVKNNQEHLIQLAKRI